MVRRGFARPAERFAENIADRDRADRRARHVRQFEHRHRGRGLGDLDLDLLVVEFSRAQLLAKRIARGGRGRGADERIQDALLRRKLGAR